MATRIAKYLFKRVYYAQKDVEKKLNFSFTCKVQVKIQIIRYLAQGICIIVFLKVHSS